MRVHDATKRSELFVGARGEGLVAEDLDVGRDEAESGLAVVLAVAARFGGGHLEDCLRVGAGGSVDFHGSGSAVVARRGRSVGTRRSYTGIWSRRVTRVVRPAQ